MNNNTLNIVIADDHPLFRAGVKQTIGTTNGMKVVGEAKDGVTALKLIRETIPDIAILDIKMPEKSGLEVLAELSYSGCHTKIVLLTMYENPHYFYQAISLGAKGYILKESALDDLIKGIEKVQKSGIYVSERIYQLLDKEKLNRNELKENIESVNSLSDIDRQLLKLVGRLKTSIEIAEILSLSFRTIENRRMRICEKLNLKGVNSLLQFTIENSELF